MPANNYISVVEKTMLVLEAFRGEHNVRLSDLASRTRLVKSSVFRILFTLEHLGYIEKGPQGTYSLTGRLGGLSGDFHPQSDLAAQAGPFMASLLHRFQETTNLGVLDNGEVLYIRVMESPQVFRLAAHAGMRSPVHSTALGKCLLSRLPRSEVEAILKQRPLRALTPRTPRDRASFYRELARTREQGYGVDNEEDSRGIRCLAAPILDTGGSVLAGLSISAPAVRLQPDRDSEIAGALKEACAQISKLRGYTVGSRQLKREAR
ncbi:MAG: IclR family transcriptional regulator [Acidobacteriota bacterium]|nr:IclR family transcriptional regulator [Acidobacteriota bacterium]